MKYHQDELQKAMKGVLTFKQRKNKKRNINITINIPSVSPWNYNKNV